MQNVNRTIRSASNQDWQIFGELELTVGLASDPIVRKWFSVILGFLSLQTDFNNKVLRSAQETISRAMHVESVMKSEHIHVIILVPENLEWGNQSWGFFRIERIGEDTTASDHTIEFFLYQEG